MRNLKSEKGAITILILITILFLTTFLISSYIIMSNKMQSQREVISDTKQIYESYNLNEMYESYFDRSREGVPTEKIQQVEYIESTGTQYIDTGIGASNIGQSLYIELDFQLTECVQNTWICGTKELECGYFNGFYSHFTYSQTSDYLARTTAYGSSTKTSNNKVLLFARDFNGTTAEYRPAKVKIYSASIYLDDELVRDFVPVLDTNNVACLYDKVEGKYYYNAGTGTFSYGNQV